MDHQANISLGLEYKVTVKDPITGSVKHETAWSHNLILDNTGDIFQKGFTSVPSPLLGSDGRAVAANQPGVLAPIEQLRSVSAAFDPATTQWEQLAANIGRGTWVYDFDFINLSASTVTVREIGLPGLSRALLKGNDGNPASIPIAQYDQLTVGLRFVLSVNHPNQTVNIVDLGGGIVDTFTVSYVLKPPANIKDAVWWKLFNFEGPLTILTAGADVVISDYGLETKVNSRDINYRLSLTAEDSYEWRGLRYRFACNVPIVEAIFSKSITVPASQKFELVINPKW